MAQKHPWDRLLTCGNETSSATSRKKLLTSGVFLRVSPAILSQKRQVRQLRLKLASSTRVTCTWGENGKLIVYSTSSFDQRTCVTQSNAVAGSR